MAKQSEREVQDVDETVTDLTTAKSIGELIAQLGLSDSPDAVKVQARLVTAENPKGARVYDGPPETFDLMNLAREFGSGKYQITLRGPSEAAGGRVCILANEYETVKLTLAEEQTLINRMRAPEPTQATTPQTDLGAQIIGALAPVLSQIATAVSQRPDPFADMERLANVMRAMQPQTPATPPPAPVDPVDGLTTRMAKIAQLKMVKEIMGDIGGAIAEDDELSQLLGTGGGMLKELVSLARETKKERAAPVEKDVTPATETPETDEMELMFRAALGMLEKAAAKNADVKIWASNVVDQADTLVTLPNGQQCTLETILRDTRWFDVLKNKAPNLAQYQPWLTKVRDAAIKLLDKQ